MLPFLLAAVGAIGKVAAVVQTVQTVASTVQNLTGGARQPEASQNDSSAAAASGGTATNQPITALPEKIQRALSSSDGTIKRVSTDALRAELASRLRAEKSPVSDVAAAQPNTASPKAAATSCSTCNNPESETNAATAVGSSGATAASNPTNARTRMQDGQAVFENDNYIIAAGDDNNVVIYNKKTKEVYDAVGDPSMKIDGKAGFSGKGTMSLMLNDGTKVTMDRADDGKGGTLASKLTITNGAYGAQIKGIDTTKKGDLAVQEFSGQGQALDEQVSDGVTMEENQDININNGRGFVVKDINGAATLVSNEYLAKVSQAAAKAGNLDQFDLQGGQQGSAENDSTVTTQAQDTTAQTPTTAPANAASVQTIQEQVKNTMEAIRDCFGNGQQPVRSRVPTRQARPADVSPNASPRIPQQVKPRSTPPAQIVVPKPVQKEQAQPSIVPNDTRRDNIAFGKRSNVLFG